MKNYENLERLAAHLESGDLLHAQFTLTRYNSGDGSIVKGVENCGSAGCALGEMPLLDKRWTFNRLGMLTFDEDQFAPGSVCRYFDISPIDLHSIFYISYSQSAAITRWGTPFPSDSSTAASVAASCRAYIAWDKENNQ